MIAFLRRNRRLIDVALRAAFVVVLIVFALIRPVETAQDAHAYWAVDLDNPYTRPVATEDAFTYTPPAAFLFSIIGSIPFDVFVRIWTVVIGLALLWLAGPWALLFLPIPFVASDVYLGNIHVLLAAAIVGSLRWPALWAIPLLTKPTVGLGLLWFAARGEWRRLVIAIGATGVLAALASVLAPGLWPAWIEYVLGTGLSPDTGTAFVVPISLLVRLPVAVLLVIWGARTDRPWTLATASMLALPVLWQVGLAMLVGAFAVSPWGPLRQFAHRWAPGERATS